MNFFRFFRTTFIVALLTPTALLAQSPFFKIGTGDITGLYYPIAGAVCRTFVTLPLAGHTPMCLAEATQGSGDNIDKMRDGRLQAAIVQSDALRKAFKNQPDTPLRVIAPIHDEMFTVVAGEKTGIKTFEDLRGKVLNVGELKSGNYMDVVRLLDALKLTMDFFDKTTYLPPLEAMAALCKGDIDATVYMVGHPNRNTGESLSRCDGHLVTLSPEKIQKVTDKYPDYLPGKIAENTYPNQPSVATFALTALLVTRIDTDETLVFELSKALMNNLDTLQSVVPALKKISPEDLSRELPGLSRHAGAQRFFSPSSAAN